MVTAPSTPVPPRPLPTNAAANDPSTAVATPALAAEEESTAPRSAVRSAWTRATACASGTGFAAELSAPANGKGFGMFSVPTRGPPTPPFVGDPLGDPPPTRRFRKRRHRRHVVRKSTHITPLTRPFRVIETHTRHRPMRRPNSTTPSLRIRPRLALVREPAALSLARTIPATNRSTRPSVHRSKMTPSAREENHPISTASRRARAWRDRAVDARPRASWGVGRDRTMRNLSAFLRARVPRRPLERPSPTRARRSRSRPPSARRRRPTSSTSARARVAG